MQALPATRQWMRCILPCASKQRYNTTVTTGERLKSLRALLSKGRILRGIEVHSGLSALIAQHAKATRGKDGSVVQFDFMWGSSLTQSTVRGKPDIECVDTSTRVSMIEEAFEVSAKPMIYDGDTGGLPEIFAYTVRSLERVGVSAVIIEDKAGLKQNSLFGTDRVQELADPSDFCKKIQAGQRAKVTDDFMIFSRLEAMIAGAGVEEALRRARIYIESGGVDGIMVHSKEKHPNEIYTFLEAYEKFPRRVPVVVVPTTYNDQAEWQLWQRGANLCIYANQLLRAAYPAMMNVAESILENGRSLEADSQLLGIKEVLSIIEQA